MSTPNDVNRNPSTPEFMWRAELLPEELISTATELHSALTIFLRDVETLTEPLAYSGIRIAPKLVKGKLKLRPKEFNEPWQKGSRRIAVQAAADALCKSYKTLGRTANRAIEAGGKYRFAENNMSYERERIPDHEQRLFVYGFNPMRAIGEAPFVSHSETISRNAQRFRSDDIITNKTIEILRQTETGLKEFIKEVLRTSIPRESIATKPQTANSQGERLGIIDHPETPSTGIAPPIQPSIQAPASLKSRDPSGRKIHFPNGPSRRRRL